MVELAISDAHIGKLAWGKETGWGDYDTKLAVQTVHAVTGDLLAKAETFAGGKALLLVGNDLMNVDSSRNETTAGTRQDGDTRYKRIFSVTLQLYIAIIEEMLAPRFKEVEVMCVSGNHDRESMYMLGEALQCRFHNTQHVRISNEASQRKYTCWGRNLLGFTHGDGERLTNLPLIMAQERPMEWSRTKHRAWHIGHFHRQRRMDFMTLDEETGVLVQVLPTVCAPDSWHSSKGYVAHTRTALAFVWDKEEGNIATYSSVSPTSPKRLRR